MEVRWTKKALQDLLEIKNFLSDKSESSALKIVAEILNIENTISEFPKSGAVENSLKLKRTYRFHVVRNYKIIYRIGKSTVYINKVFDCRKDPSRIIE